MFFVITVAAGLLLFVAGIMDLKSRTVSRGIIVALFVVCLAGVPVKVLISQIFGLWDIRISEVPFCSVCCIHNYDTCVSYNITFAKRKQKYEAAVSACAVCGVCNVYNGGRVK